MWIANQETLQGGRGIKFRILKEEKLLTFEEVIILWKSNKMFRTFYNQILMNCPLDAFFWEHPPMNKSELGKLYEFVLMNSNFLSTAKPEKDTFRKYYDEQCAVVNFSNLRGDAQLIVPCPLGKAVNYTHLAQFVRSGLTIQIDMFWKTIGQQYETILQHRKTWLSTAGLGVHWLHVRLDSRPKYYRWQAYKKG